MKTFEICRIQHLTLNIICFPPHLARCSDAQNKQFDCSSTPIVLDAAAGRIMGGGGGEERKEAIDRGKGKGEETGDGRTIE